MPYIATDLVPLIQTARFNLWHYRSTDLKADIVAGGYFSGATSRLQAGDMMIVQAADAMAILPVRANAGIGPGVTLDGSVTPIALTRTVAQTFRLVQAASAVVATIVLAPLVAGIIIGTAIPVSAQVTGPINQVVVSLRNSQGAIIPPTRLVPVEQGYATTTLPTPAIGTGYRIQVEDGDDRGIVVTSRSFNILPDLQLMLTEDGVKLLQENGSAIAQY
ncbi:hypothetical protein [Roseococcus sp. YIM B11640]|uniref:hypothetical protein n=1 Tax=Roseococcus sp. YIM B11640 TaxID=3133973 RepID=UPI003C7E2191